MDIKKGSLVLYKNSPAHVVSVSDKIEIELSAKTVKKVRPKDLVLLHKGPLNSLAELKTIPVDIEKINEVRELILDEPVYLSELAELIFDGSSPSTVWTTWNLLIDELYFKGDIDSISSRTDEEVNDTLQQRELKEKEAKGREELIERIKSCNVLPKDEKYLKEIEKIALCQISKSRLMQDLKQEQTPEKAHSILLKTGFWDSSVNPYPKRFNILADQIGVPEIPILPEEDRLDLTYLDTYAIDDEGCNDPDDAISFEDGCIWVHIADAAAVVKSGSELDRYAQNRGVNLYIPELVVTMLPEALTKVLGLGLNDVSPALSFKLKFDDSDSIALEKIVPSWVKVKMLSYEKADNLIEKEPLSSIYKLTGKYRERRIANGAVELKLPETKIKKDGDDIVIKPILSLSSREMVTDAMLMVGEAVAAFAEDNEIPMPFATQTLVDEVVFSNDLAGMFAARKKLKAAVLQIEPQRHAGLGLEHYIRTTSPLRRYLDLLVHQQIRAYLNDEPLMDSEKISSKIALVRDSVADRVLVERSSNRHWKLVYMEKMQWTGEAVLVDKYENKGTFIIPELAFETRLAIDKNMELNSIVQLAFNGCDLSTLTGYFTIK